MENNENIINEQNNEIQSKKNNTNKKKYLKRVKNILVRIVTASIPVIIYHISQTVEQIEISEIVYLLNEIMGIN